MANPRRHIEPLNSAPFVDHFKFEVLNYGTASALFYPINTRDKPLSAENRIAENNTSDKNWIEHLCNREVLNRPAIDELDRSPRRVTFTDSPNQQNLYLTQLQRCMALEVRQQLGRNSTSDSMIIPCVFSYIEQVTVGPMEQEGEPLYAIECIKGTVTADIEPYQRRFVNRLLSLDYPSNWSYVLLQETSDEIKQKIKEEQRVLMKHILALFSRPKFSQNGNRITWTVYLLKREADADIFKRKPTDVQTQFYEKGLKMDMKMLYHAELDFIVIRDTCKMLNRSLPFRRVDVVLNPSMEVLKMEKAYPVANFANVIREITPIIHFNADLGQMFPVLNAEQMNAVACGVNDFDKPIAENRVSIVNGGPGTGKTTLVAALIKYLVHHWGREADFRIIITAADNASVNRLTEELMRIGVHSQLNNWHGTRAAVVRLGHTPPGSLAYRLELGQLSEALSDDLGIKVAEARYSLLQDEVKVAIGTPQSIALEKHLSEMFYRADPDDPDASQQYIRYVIVDEYSQMSLAHTNHLFALPCTKFLFVGDCHKLPPTTISHGARELGYDCTYPGLLKVLLGEQLAYKEVHLRDQYRMCPSIIQLPNLYTYDGELRVAQPRRINPHLACLRPALVLRCDTTDEEIIDARVDKGQVARGPVVTPERREYLHLDTFKNEKEATLVVKALDACLRQLCRTADDLTEDQVNQILQMRITFAILTFYHGQKTLIDERLRQYFGFRYEMIRNLVTLTSVDAFNSYEADVVILSCTRGRNEKEIWSVGFLSMRARLNVALTRARSVFIAVINEKRFTEGTETREVPVHFLHFTKDAELRQSLLTVAYTVPVADLQLALSAQPLEAVELQSGQAVVVSFVASAESFFVQPNPNRVTQMFNNLRHHFNLPNVSNLGDKAEFIIRGQLLCIRVRGDYYRVQVLFQMGARFAVRYIDYGCLGVATATQLYQLPAEEQFTGRPLAVHCCQNSGILPNEQETYSVTLQSSESDLKQAVILTAPSFIESQYIFNLHRPGFTPLTPPQVNANRACLLPLVELILNLSPRLSNFTTKLSDFYNGFHEKAYATFNGDDIVVFKIANYALRGQVDGFKRWNGNRRLWRQFPMLRAIDFGFFIAAEPKNIYQLDKSRFGVETQPPMGSVDDTNGHWSTNAVEEANRRRVVGLGRQDGHI